MKTRIRLVAGPLAAVAVFGGMAACSGEAPPGSGGEDVGREIDDEADDEGQDTGDDDDY